MGKGGGVAGAYPVTVRSVALGVKLVEDGGSELEVLQVIAEQVVQAGALHLHRHVLALQHRPVHLPAGGRRNRAGRGVVKRLRGKYGQRKVRNAFLGSPSCSQRGAPREGEMRDERVSERGCN